MQSSPLPSRTLGAAGPVVTRLGLGLAAIGRPSYHTLGHDQDLQGRSSRRALEAHAHAMLDSAWSRGIRTFDVARSYGDGENFLSHWLKRHPMSAEDVTVCSKWGYTYTADWRPDATVHEVKNHGLPTLLRQWPESAERLLPWLDVYYIHSATFETGVLQDPAVLDALRELRDSRGLRVGLTVTGTNQADVLDFALREAKDVFSVVQATFNLLDSAVGPSLQRAHDAGWGVVVKEGVANGRLTSRATSPAVRQTLLPLAEAMDTTPDAISLAWILSHDFVDVALSGASTVEQLHSNLQCTELHLTAAHLKTLSSLAQTPEAYWGDRKKLPWT